MNHALNLVKSFYESEDNLFTGLSDDIEWHESEGLPYGGIYRGKDALMQGVFSHIMSDWEDFAAAPYEFLQAGEDKIVSLGYYSGKFKKTGKTLKAKFAHVYTIEGGKVVKFEQFGDSHLFREAMTP